MACTCDRCDEDIYLDEANEYKGEIVCDECLYGIEDEEEDEEADKTAEKLKRFTCKRCRFEETRPHKLLRCRTCPRQVPACALIEKNEAKEGLCPVCAHAYELAIFTPADHDAANCDLCKLKTKDSK